MDILNWIAYQWLRCYMYLWLWADWCEDKPFLGGWVHDTFLALAHIFFERDEEGNILETCLYFKTLEFGTEIDHIIVAIKAFINWDNLLAWFKDWGDKILEAWNWVTSAITNILAAIGDWWLEVQETVKGWIAIAVEGLAPLLEAWDNFWTVIFPTLVSFTWLGTWWDSRLLDIQGLIDTAFAIRKSWWEGWQDIRDTVIEFFTNPLNWLVTRIEVWFWEEEQEEGEK